MNLNPKGFGICLLVVMVIACALLVRGNVNRPVISENADGNSGLVDSAIANRYSTQKTDAGAIAIQPRTTRPARDERTPLSHAEWQSVLQSKLQRMDDTLRAEPVSPSWSVAANKQIANVMTEENLAELGATQPQSYEMECRTSSCRISMSFQDSSVAENTVMALTTSIGNAFPEAVVVPVQKPDGSVQYFVYASASKGSKLLSR